MGKYIGPNNDPNDLKTIIVNLSERLRVVETARFVPTGNLFVPIPFVDSDWIPPTATTTSNDFVPLQWSSYYRQKSSISVVVFALCSDATTVGEVQVTGSLGETLGGPQIVDSDVQYVSFGGDASGPLFNASTLTVQARRISGAGTVGVRVYGAYEYD